MSKFDPKSMFESLQNSLEHSRTSSGAKEFLRVKPGNTYLLRLLPYVDDMNATFFHYFYHGWNSRSTGQYVEYVCPKTFGENNCFLCTKRFAHYNRGNSNEDLDRKLSYMLKQKERHLVNVYVLDDPTNEENNGQVKVLRFTKTVHAKFHDAISGEDSDEFGYRVFDLGKAGCNFKLKVETTVDGKNEFTSYANSRFTAPSPIPGMTEDKIEKIYTACYDLSQFVKPSSEEEIKEAYKVHLLQTSDDTFPPLEKETSQQETVALKSSKNNGGKDNDVLSQELDKDLVEDSVTDQQETEQTKSLLEKENVEDSDLVADKLEDLLSDLENI